MEAIILFYRGEPLRTFEIGQAGLEVGSSPGCDVVVHDAQVGERELLVRYGDDRVEVVRLSGEPRPLPFPIGEPMAIGERYAIARVRDSAPPADRACRTEPITVREAHEGASLSVLIGQGSAARRATIRKRPLTIGSSEDCDLRLHDRAASGRHCRIEPHELDVLIRDLGSRNGTYVDGVRTLVARIAAGTRLRIGRTDLWVVAQGDSADARSDGLIASSSAMQQVLELVERYARLPYTVLVTGESGTGKEGIARALHLRGPRRERPFVAINAGGLPRDLIESELFGHEKGAFTGAQGLRRGVFEQADGGTLFLDEIGELPLALQARLLRVLETREVRRVGSEHAILVDVRVVVATHRDLHQMVAEGSFRRDLFYRLAQLFVHLSPLRERPDDIRALARHFLEQVVRDVGPRSLSDDALALLGMHGWPGNARELRNVIQAAAAGSAGVIDANDIEGALLRIAGPMLARPAPRAAVREVVASYGGNLSAASRALGIPRSTLRDRLRAERPPREP